MTVHIRIATYNVHKCRGIDRRTSPERIAEVIDALDADVVAIQEVLDVREGHRDHDQSCRLLAGLTGYRSCFGENRRLHGGPYGNMTITRLPIKVCENYDLTWRHRERRGCLRSDILLENGSLLHIFNVHLGTSFLERRHQGRKLLTEKVLNRLELSGPRLIVGDFNEWTRGLASRLMRGTFNEVDPRRFLRYGRTYPGILPLLHLDHFYFDNQLSLRSFRVHRSRKALIASDHLPLVADFAIETR